MFFTNICTRVLWTKIALALAGLNSWSGSEFIFVLGHTINSTPVNSALRAITPTFSSCDYVGFLDSRKPLNCNLAKNK